jgi:VWFA-related protein
MPTARAVAGSTLAAVVLLAFGGVLSGQAQQAPVFRARTVLVPVYVVAVDADGNPVTDLTAGDFTVMDRGTRQEISVFDRVTRVAAEPAPPAFRLPADLPRDVATNRSTDTDRVVVVVVDDLHIYRRRMELARTLTVNVVKELHEGSTMALLLTSGKDGAQMTDDRAQLIAATARIQGGRAVRRPTEAESPMNAGVWDPETSNGLAHAGVDRPLQDFFDNMSIYDTLEKAARMLRSRDGRRKVFVLITEGPGFDLRWLPENTSPCLARGDACYHDAAVLDMMRSMQRSDVATYALDPRGLVESGDLLSECYPPPPKFLYFDPCSEGFTDDGSAVRWAQRGLETMAKVSGGFAVTNTDDLIGGIARIRSDLDNYYLLGFYPRDVSKGYRRISVSVDRPGLTLRYRQGYDAGEEDAPEAGKDELTALATGPLPNPDLPLRLFAAPFPGGVRARVAVTLEVAAPRDDVSDAAGRLSDQLRYSVLAADEKSGKVIQNLGNTATLSSRTPLGATAPPLVFYQVPVTMSLPPGRYQLRASAISEKLARGGSVYLTLVVPDYRKADVELSGVVLGSTAGPQIPVARGPAPPVVPFGPSLMREFSRRDSLRIYFEVSRRGQIGVPVRIDVIDYRDQVLRSVERHVELREPGVVDTSLPLADLPTGAYRLRVTAGAPGQGPERVIGFVVR